jgi:microcystin-dependent protein
MARNYRSIAEPKTLAANLPEDPTELLYNTVTLNNTTGLPTPPFILVVDPDTSNEEVILCNSTAGGTSYNVTRATETGASPKPHTSGTSVARHMIVGSDLQLVHNHLDNSSLIHGLGSGEGDVVGTAKAQTLTNKTLTTPKINENVNLTATSTELNVLDGITASTAELNIMDGVTSTAAELNILDGATLTTTELNYVDGVTSSIQSQLNALEVFPKGMIAPFAGASATVPTGWLLCDGSAVSRTTYSALWDVLRNGGSTSPYGNGDGTTTFNLPDLLGRVPMGAGAGTGLTSRALGSELGDETVLLTAAQSGTTAHGHSASGSTSLGDAGAQTATGSISTGGHGHSLTMRFTSPSSHDHAVAGISNPLPAMQGDPSSGDIGNNNGTAIAGVGDLGGSASVSVGNHNHTTSTSVSVTNATAAPAAEAHTNIQPSTVVNFIIKH